MPRLFCSYSYRLLPNSVFIYVDIKKVINYWHFTSVVTAYCLHCDLHVAGIAMALYEPYCVMFDHALQNDQLERFLNLAPLSTVIGRTTSFVCVFQN